jgi:histidinol dehydrogenase
LPDAGRWCYAPRRTKKGEGERSILYIASLLGIDKVFRVGGVQAIAAMAHGTESVPKVHKIFGPGNQYVTMAKQVVSRDTVAIDMPAGPSELAVVADSRANPAFIASDLLSQAEHGPDSQVLLITDSATLIDRVEVELQTQLALLPRRDIAAKALENSKMILLNNQEEMMSLVNEYAPEHLIIMTDNYACSWRTRWSMRVRCSWAIIALKVPGTMLQAPTIPFLPMVGHMLQRGEYG